MIKSTTIFTEKSKEEKPEYRSERAPSTISLTRREYRKLITAAYQEGRNDAIKEHQQKKQQKKSLKNNKEEIEEEGKQEAVKKHAKEAEENRQRFQSIADRQDIELLRAQSIYPFTLFTDTLVIDTTKVTIAKRQLFATEYISTIPLKDLSDVNVQTYLFMGTIIIKYMPQSSSPGMNEPVVVRIPNLKRNEAIKAKNILKGALVARAEEIDIATLPPEEVAQVLHKFGESEGVV